MIEDRIQLMQSTIEAAPKIPDQTTSELLRQVAALKSEIGTLAETAFEGHGPSIQGLEESHHVLSGAVNRFSMELSNRGL